MAEAFLFVIWYASIVLGIRLVGFLLDDCPTKPKHIGRAWD